MQYADRRLTVRQSGILPAGEQAGVPALIDLPCSMLVRDLASVSSDRWVRENGSFTLKAPKGSTALVEGPDAEEVLWILQAAGPKTLQAFVAIVDLWKAQTSGAKFAGVSPAEIGTRLGARNHKLLEPVIDALARVHFVSGPSTARYSVEPGPPIRLHPGAGGSSRRFAPGQAWIHELTGARRQAARLPASFLSLHGKNDRYKILLSWYLAIMLRVNRKHGFHYRVGLRNVLEGAGIDVPGRNVSRFLAAIYRALTDLPGINFAGPALTLYSPEDILSRKFDFWIDPLLLSAYCRGDLGDGVPECAILPSDDRPIRAERARTLAPAAQMRR